MVLVIQEWQQNQMLILGQHIHIGLFHIMTYQLFTMAKLQIYWIMRRQMEKKGHRFTSNCDSELLAVYTA